MANLPRQGRGSSTDLGLKCPKCEVMVVLKKDYFLTCKLCEFSWHKKCIEDLDEDEYNVLKRNEKKKNKNIHWYCSKQCDRAANKFLSKMAMFEEEIAKVEKRVSSLDTSVSAIQNGVFTEGMVKTVEDIVQERVSVYESDEQVSGATNDNIKNMLEKDRKNQMDELEDRLRRKKNLIVFKLPEDQNKTADQNKAEDINYVDKILEETGVQAKPKDIRRLGQAKKDGKHRPLRIIFESEKERDEIMFGTIKISKEKKENDGRLCSSLSVRRDLTKVEREEENRLFTELKRRREDSQASGDDKAKWVMRRGKIMNIGNYEEEARGGMEWN